MKNKKLIIIIIIVTVLLIIGLGATLLFKNRNHNSNDPVNGKTYGIYTSIEDLVEHITAYYGHFSHCDRGIYLDFEDRESYTIDDFSKSTVYYLVMNYLTYNNKIDTQTKEGKDYSKFSKNDVMNAIIALFGKDYSEKITLDEVIKINDSTYTLNGDYYEGITKTSQYCKNYSAVRYDYSGYDESGEEVTLIFGIYWVKPIEENGKYSRIIYYDSDNTISSTNKLDKSLMTNYIEYNFIPENGNYILKDITDANDTDH